MHTERADKITLFSYLSKERRHELIKKTRPLSFLITWHLVISCAVSCATPLSNPLYELRHKFLGHPSVRHICLPPAPPPASRAASRVQACEARRSSLEALSAPPRALEGPARIKHSLSNNIFCPFFVGSGSSSRLFPDDIKKGRACTSRVNEGSRRSDVAVSRGTLTAARFSRPPLFPASPPLSLPRPLFSSSSSLPLVHAFGL